VAVVVAAAGLVSALGLAGVDLACFGFAVTGAATLVGALAGVDATGAGLVAAGSVGAARVVFLTAGLLLAVVALGLALAPAAAAGADEFFFAAGFLGAGAGVELSGVRSSGVVMTKAPFYGSYWKANLAIKPVGKGR
jgi:hypothetical protein